MPLALIEGRSQEPDHGVTRSPRARSHAYVVGPEAGGRQRQYGQPMGHHDDKRWDDRVLLGLEDGEDPLEWVPLSQVDALADIGHRIAALLLKGPHEETLIAEPRRLETLEGDDLLDRAARQVVAWWGDPTPLAEHQQRWKRVLGLGPLLARATARDTVLAEVRDCANELFPDRPVLLLERSGPLGEWVRIGGGRGARAPREILPDPVRLGTPGIWDCVSDPEAPPQWKVLVRGLGCERLAHLPMTEDDMLAVGLPGMDRLAVDEWPLLRTLAHTAGRALSGIDHTDGPRAALTDEPTGLPNRLHADVILERMLGAAARGDSLSVLLVTLGGHGTGHSTTTLADAARGMEEAVRQADLVARYDDHTFLLALPRCAAIGAQKVLHRLRSHIDPPFSAGAAEFGPETGTQEALVAAARSALERSRRVAAHG